VCCSTTETVTEEKTCWNVKCEKVCVPAIRLPWQPGGSPLTLFSWLKNHDDHCHCGADVVCHDPDGRCALACECHPQRCGKVRCVSVLEPDTYEVEICQCKWEIRRLPPCNGCGCTVSGGDGPPLNETDAAETELPPPPR
jgi:hypothetical protein